MEQGCIFCDILAGSVESEILYRDDHCFVIRDISPRAPVHLLIIPVLHFTYLTNVTPAYYPVLGDLFLVAEKMAKREGVGSTGYRLVINQGEHAGQVVPHLHLHLLAGRDLGLMG